MDLKLYLERENPEDIDACIGMASYYTGVVLETRIEAENEARMQQLHTQPKTRVHTQAKTRVHSVQVEAEQPAPVQQVANNSPPVPPRNRDRRQRDGESSEKSPRAKTTACFNCNKEDHWRRDCSEPPKKK